MAKSVDARALALQALSRAIADPAPKPLFGSAKTPGFFAGSAAGPKSAADLCISSGWIEAAGEQGTGKKRVSLYRITPEGVREAIDSNETTVLLRDMLDTLGKQRDAFELARQQIDAVHSAIEQQEVVLRELLAKQKAVASTNAPAPAQTPAQAVAATDPTWTQDILRYLRDFRARNPLIECSLPELFHRVAAPRKLSIGQFHDGLRALVARRAIQLFPYTGSDYALEEGEYGLIWEKEIKYYAATDRH